MVNKLLSKANVNGMFPDKNRYVRSEEYYRNSKTDMIWIWHPVEFELHKRNNEPFYSENIYLIPNVNCIIHLVCS